MTRIVMVMVMMMMMAIGYIDDNDDDEEYIDDAEILSDVLSVVRRISGAE